MRKLLIVVIFAILSMLSYAEDGKWSHMMDTIGYDMDNEEIPVEIGILDDEILVLKFPYGYPEEITEIMSKVSLKQLNAPCIVYNLDGYYDSLKAMLKHMIDMGLSSEERQKGIYFAESLEQITDILCSLKED